MLFTIRELVDLVIMTVAIGYIFSGFFQRKPLSGYDPLKHFSKNTLLEDIKHGAIIAAPAIVLHELSHKFTAMAFGAQATLHAPIFLYAIVIVMRLLNVPLLFFVGGYVTYSGLDAIPSAVVSISGPLMNLILYLILIGAVKFNLFKRYHEMMTISGRLNLFLFIFNMIPIPGFDGYHVVANLLSALT